MYFEKYRNSIEREIYIVARPRGYDLRLFHVAAAARMGVRVLCSRRA
jgi:hypothetical protein